MLKHYIKFAFRNFRSNKVIFAGSLATLCLGALCISLLYTYIENQLTMNDFSKKEVVETKQTSSSTENQHKRQGDIYMMMMRTSSESQWKAVSPSMYINFDYKTFPEIENIVNLKRCRKDRFKFIYEDKKFTPEGLVVDSTFFKVFDFKLKKGNINTALNSLESVLLSEEFAKKIFGDKDPMGKSITLTKNRGGEEYIHIVNGVVKIPANSSIQFDFLLTNFKGSSDYSMSLNNKYGIMGADFILTKPDFDKNSFIKKIEGISNKVPNVQPQYTESKTSIIALNDIYLNRDVDIYFYGIFSKFGDKQSNDIIILIMLVILVISVLNLSNLQIININATLKQIGISKINGAKKRHILFQKITEVSLFIILSTFIIALLYQLVFPVFCRFFNVVLSPSLLKILIINGIILLLLAGLSLIYPTIVFYKTSAIKSLKKQTFTTSRLAGKKLIIVVQYTLTIILLIASVAVSNQLELLLSKDLGFTSTNIIQSKIFYPPSMPPNWRSLNKEEQNRTRDKMFSSYRSLKNELASHTSILSLSQGSSPIKPTSITVKTKNSDRVFTKQYKLIVNPNYEKVLGLELLEGRFFDVGRDHPENNARRVVINEAAKQYWNIKDISLTNIQVEKRWDYDIIGVVKNFNYQHLSVKPQPLIMMYGKFDEDFIIRFREGSIKNGLEFVKSFFNKLNPGETFKYSFLSDEIATLYQKEKRLSTIYIVFTIIALFISAIGLFTIALYDTQRRVKEVGVRKVNGATINEIMVMLNKDFIKWVVIAFIIACPIAYYAMSKWLENFAYKTSLSWGVFALAGVFTLIIALLTVSWQTYKAATRNPVESLRDE